MPRLRSAPEIDHSRRPGFRRTDLGGGGQFSRFSRSRQVATQLGEQKRLCRRRPSVENTVGQHSQRRDNGRSSA
jgi:hypothetical protein